MNKVDQLTAMSWCVATWNGVTPETIANCFGHTSLIDVGKLQEMIKLILQLMKRCVCLLHDSRWTTEVKKMPVNLWMSMNLHQMKPLGGKLYQLTF